MSKVHVISGFPGIGKSFLNATGNYTTFDLDRADVFDKENFPDNCIQRVKELKFIHESDNQSKDVYILVNSHDKLRDALVDNGIPFTLIYPSEDCKMEYISRYRDRGSTDALINVIGSNFLAWVAQCDKQSGAYKIKLKPGQYLSDVIGEVK